MQRFLGPCLPLLFAQLVMADALVLLSAVDGVYTADPGRDETAKHIPEVRRITREMQAMAGETRSDIGSGGMSTKVQAARIATHAGCSTIIASGQIEHPLDALSTGARCTVFRPGASVGQVLKAESNKHCCHVDREAD